MSELFVCHVEWGAPEPSVLEAFFTQLFGWKFQPFAPGYLMYLPAQGGVSVGINQSDQMRSGGSPSVSVRVNDLDATLLRAVELGGQVAVPKTAVGNGAFAFISAPDGNLIGLQQL
ncbi:MAG: VOC family protein [Anaerolineales bacterium]|nr:MAG: VOC family protein [Anaerolineales bacterium]